MFVGYPRSGHTLIGSLLDAHPQMVVAHELDALKYVEAGFSKYQIFHLILDNSRQFTRSGRSCAGFSYNVPNQWQGTYQCLQVIGDKKGGKSTMRLRAASELLERLHQTIDCDTRFIHVVRNPFDNVATMCTRQQYGPDLQKNLDQYVRLCETNRWLKDQVARERVTDLRLETFIQEPKESLAGLCRFLGVTVTDEYLSACARLVMTSPSRTRNRVEWSRALRQQVDRVIEEFPFLSGYAFDT
jgi:hypothetical protein